MSPIIRTCARRILSGNKQGTRKHIARAPDRRRISSAELIVYRSLEALVCGWVLVTFSQCMGDFFEEQSRKKQIKRLYEGGE